MKKATLAALCVAAALAMPSPPARAASTELGQCTSIGVMAFNPRLSTAFVMSGSITYSYTARCVVEYTNGSTGIETYNAGATYSYTGSCVSASVVNAVDPSTTGLLVGGTSLVRARSGLSGGATWAGAFALASRNGNPCDMTTADVVSVAPGVTPGTIP